MQVSFDHLNRANRLVVTTNTNKTLKTFEDAGTLAKVVTTLKKYPVHWDVPIGGVPIAELRLNFYEGDTFLGNVGLAETFLTAMVNGNFVSRTFDAAGYLELVKLVDMETPKLKHVRDYADE